MTVGLDWPLCVPVLTDGEVTLRAHTPADIDAVWQMATDPLMQEFTTVPEPYRRKNAEQFVSEIMPAMWAQDKREWAIEVAGDDGVSRFAGNIGVRGAPAGEIAYALHPWARGRDIMTRAAALAIDWAFTEGGVELITWRALVGNLGSLRVAHALGFTLDAKVPSMVVGKEGPADMWVGHLAFGDFPVPRATWLDPVIEAGSLRLRPMTLADIPRIVEACNDPETARWLGAFMGQPYTVAEARRFVEDSWWDAARGDALTWTVADRETDRVLGNLALSQLHETPWGDSADIGYWTHPDSRGLGLTTQAVQLAVAHAFDPAGLGRRRVQLQAAAGNLTSNLIALGLGFTRYGTRRAAERLGDGSWDDLHCYELMRPGD